MSTPPRRWIEEAAGEEREAAQLLQRASAVAVPDEERLERIRMRLLSASLSDEHGAAAPHSSSKRVKSALVAAGVMTALAAAAAVAPNLVRFQSQEATAIDSSGSASAPTLQGALPPATVPPPAPSIEPPPSTAPAASVAPRASAEPGAPSASAGLVTSESELKRESAMLARAVAALRKEGSPSRALSLLDEYRSEFPRGRLSGEATLLRIDALVALGRNKEALALLERLPLERMPRSKQLLELRDRLRGGR